MAYITNKERAWRVRTSNQSYFIRKVVIAATVIFLIVLTIFAVITIYNFTEVAANYQKGGEAQALIRAICDAPLSLFSATDIEGGFHVTLSGFGWFMCIWTAATLGLSVASLVLMLLMKSPKAAKKNINVLQGAALSGKKLEAHANATQVYRERGTNPKKLKKMQAKKK